MASMSLLTPNKLFAFHEKLLNQVHSNIYSDTDVTPACVDFTNPVEQSRLTAFKSGGAAIALVLFCHVPHYVEAPRVVVGPTEFCHGAVTASLFHLEKRDSKQQNQ